MKVSREQKAEIRQKLLDASVDLFTQKGFAGATMREISKRAGFSDGTIYNYFATKEGIFYAYFDSKEEALTVALDAIEAFDSFSLKEKLQLMVETELDGYLPDREFVAIAFKALLDSPMRSFTELTPIKEKFAARVERYFNEAAQKGEIPHQPFERFLIYLFWDYMNLILLYWLRDDTTGFTNTTRLIDMSLDIYMDVVRSGIVTKSVDMLSFLLKSHIYGNIDKLFALMGLMSEARGANRGPFDKDL